MTRFPNFVGSSYTLSSVDAACERTVNMYPELVETAGVATSGNQYILRQVPGLKVRDSLGTAPIRGLYTATSTGHLYIIAGSSVYKKTSLTATPTLIGSLLSNKGQVDMSDNVSQLCIVDGQRGYFVDLDTNVLTQIPPATTDSTLGFRGSYRVGFLNQSMVFAEPNTGSIYWSALSDTSEIDALDFTVAEANPDNIVGHIVYNNEVWVGGTRSMEVFYDSGAEGLLRRQGAYMEIGLAAPFAIQKVGASLIWLGDGPNGYGMVWQSSGYQPVRISDNGLEASLKSYGSSLNSATAYTYTDSGHAFFCLNVPGAATTHVYDLATKKWSERADFSNGRYKQLRSNCSAYAFGTILAGSSLTGTLYTLDNDWPFFDHDILHFERTSPHLSNDLKRLFYSDFQLDMETGTKLDAKALGSLDDWTSPIKQVDTTTIIPSESSTISTWLYYGGSCFSLDGSITYNAQHGQYSMITLIYGSDNMSTYKFYATNFTSSRLFLNDDGNIWLYGTDNSYGPALRLYDLEGTLLKDLTSVIQGLKEDTLDIYIANNKIYIVAEAWNPTHKVYFSAYDLETEQTTTLFTIDRAVNEAPTDGVLGVGTITGVRYFCVDPNENIYFQEGTSYASDNMIRKLDTDGTITTLAGVFQEPSYVDGDTGTNRITSADYLTYNKKDNKIYFCGGQSTIRTMTLTGTVSTFLGVVDTYQDVDGTLVNTRTNLPIYLTVAPTQGHICWFTFTSNKIRKYTVGSTTYTYKLVVPDPMVMLQYSDDGGHTFNAPSPIVSGEKGQFAKRVIWHRLGQGRKRVFRVTGEGVSRATILGASVTFKAGQS